VLEYLCPYFDITLLYYNPNIFPEDEYNKRAKELVRLADAMKEEKIAGAENINVVVLPYTPSDFYEIARGKEDIPEGGARCFECYRLRLEKTAILAKEGGYDYFCTTLSISPHKNAQVLNEIGGELSEKYGVPYLYSDFKKKNGYKRSCELSEKYGLYRQDFCGCVYSANEAAKRQK
jgi:predicted adenine nucleotide alpha hydrolase (AANH) superfamily ATPase